MSVDWRRVLVKKDVDIYYALDLMNKESLRILLVVDLDRRLLGVITDGDIRRGLLRGLALTTEVSAVMNSKPLTANFGTPRVELVKIMEANEILAIPLLEDGIVFGLETFQIQAKKPTYKNPVFIMAGGFGTRLKPLTNNCPKPLLKVGDKPILELALDNFIKAGFRDFYISLHYLPDMIKEYFGDGARWNVRIQYVYEEQPLGTGGALSLLPENTSELPLIMINGDIITTVDLSKLIKFHEQHGGMATMCVREYQHQIPFGVVTGDGNKIISMLEKPVQRSFVNAGIYVINSEVRKKATSNTYLDMPILLENIIREKIDVYMFPIHEYWLDIGQLDDFNRAQIDIATLGL